MGYRDGISAGKEASVQEGFNEGFGQSVDSGYSWGLVRGVSSVLAALPDQLTEKLVCDPERKERFGKLYESTRSISANDALHSFLNDLLKHETKNTGELAQSFCYGQLDSFSKELSLLLRDCPEIKMNGFSCREE
ncbi:hypothetical protein AXF42_Ash010155 [Apostasia shenzhenica]|uniref:Essential protein Yae1 N-terminal domain-containing protein n=1 Tax=Apostasia shenzhenica TaxID=1088818 RepID=A0A2I0A9N1_9ASPA|nr:hypothetical protein AXF42_Ash010155 [Apostasia shenzhenica]